MNLEAPSIAEIAQEIASFEVRGVANALPSLSYCVAVTPSPAHFSQFRRFGLLPILPVVADTGIGRYQQTPVGVLPRSLIDALGLSQILFEYILKQIVPYCSACCLEARPPLAINNVRIPDLGFVALAVIDDDSGVALRERCEWLGSERALVQERLVRTEDLVSEDGEPVIVILPASSALALQVEASRWFARGGSDLRLVHFASRSAHGVELAKLSGNWSCPRCQARFLQPKLEQLDSAPPCATCRGVAKGGERLDGGWLLDDTKRAVACRDCDGFGLATEMANYRVFGVPLKHVMTLSPLEFCARAGELPEQLRSPLETIVDCGFGGYPFGAPVDLLSPGEVALLSVLSAQLSGFTGVRYLLDAAILGSRRGIASDHLSSPAIVIVEPQQLQQQEARESPEVAKQELGEDIVLRDVRIGVLQSREIRFPRGALTVVRGPTGSGKSLLVSVLASRFAKRNKLAHCASFGALKRCSLVQAAVDSTQTVLGALGLAQEVAKEVARTRRAQELGILEQDLILPHSSYSCGSCHGGAIGDDGVPGTCSECQGALYDWRVAELGLAGKTVAELLTTPLARLRNATWGSDWLELVVQDFPLELRDRVTLGTPLSNLSQPEVRFLSVWGGLIKVLSVASAVRGKSRAAPLATELVLIDGPNVMPVTQVQEIGRLLTKIREMGATLVYADIPEGLEFQGSCVLELQPCTIQHGERASRPHLDTRYARTFEVVGVSGSQRVAKGR